MRRRAKQTCLVGVLLLTVGLSRGAEPFPYTLDVEVRYGDGVGAELLEETLEERLPFEISRRGCYREVRAADPEAPPGDLLLLVTLDDLSERVHFETTVAQRATAVDPATRRQLVAEFVVKVTFQLVLRSERLLIIRSGRDTVFKTVRPLMPEHEEAYARQEARKRGIEKILDRAADQACKGSTKQLERQIAKTLEAAEQR